MQLFLDRGEFEPEHLSNIRGILYHDDGQVVRTAPRPLIRQLDEIPHPKRSLVGYGEMSYIMSSRGCPFKCVFCASSKFWGKYRLASEEYVVEEVVELYEHGTKIIRILDDLFTVNKRRLRRIVSLLAERNILGKVGFSVCCRANLVSEQLVALLKQLNVVSVLLGLESGSARTLQYLKGNVTVEDNRKAVRLFKDAGIQTNGLFIIGSPDETEEEIMETYEFIRQSPLDFVDIFLMTPLPGTEIWEDALSRGLVSSSMDWGLLDMRVRYQDGSVPIVSKHLSQDELRRLHKKFRRLRFVKILKALPTSPWLRQIPRVGLGILREFIARALRSLGIATKS
jgi:anaerobic magnesium-protoporphyrin IX monomethyl ester cyclase